MAHCKKIPTHLVMSLRIANVRSRLGLLLWIAAVGCFPTRELHAADENAKRPQVVGRVIDEAGEPIAGARIVVAYRIETPGEFVRFSGTSQADGTYQFTDLPVTPAEMHYVAVRAYADGLGLQQRNRMTRASSSFPPIPTDGSPIVVDFKLRQAKRSSLRILDEDARPVGGVELRSIQEKAPYAEAVWLQKEDWSQLGLAVPTSNADGEIDLRLTTGSNKLDLTFEHPDFAATPKFGVQLQEQPVEVRMDQGDEVRFVVTCKSDPAAISDAVITVSVAEEGGYQRLRFPVDASGRVTTRLRDRHATIRIEHPTLEGRPWYFYRPATSLMPFSLHRTGILKGRVVHANTGEGAAKVSVQIITGNQVVKQPLSDENGFYETKIAAGGYRVKVVSARGTWEAVDREFSIEVKPDQVQLVPDLQVTTREPLRGQVVLPSGEPVPNAIVVTSFRDDPVLADQEGRFEVLPRHERRIPIHALHPFERLSYVVSSSTAENGYRIELASEGSAVGLVTDEQGQPLAGLPVGLNVEIPHFRNGRASGATSTMLGKGFTREDGTFRFVGLSLGFRYRVTVQGKSRSAFDKRKQASNAPFDLQGKRPPRMVVKVAADLLEEVRELSESQQVVPDQMPPLKDLRWLGGRSATLEQTDYEYLLICFGSSPLSFNNYQLAHQLYGKQGLKVMGVLRTELDPEQLAQFDFGKVTFPIALDNAELRISEKFYGTEGSFAAIYDRDGSLKRTFSRYGAPILEIRNLMLYGN